jgi:hypothetical protein
MKTNFQPNEEIEPRLFTLRLTFTKPLAEARLNQIQLFSDSTKARKNTSHLTLFGRITTRFLRLLALLWPNGS